MKKRRLLAMFTAVAMVLSFATLFTPASAATGGFSRTWGGIDEYTYDITLRITSPTPIVVQTGNELTLRVDYARPDRLTSPLRTTQDLGADNEWDFAPHWNGSIWAVSNEDNLKELGDPGTFLSVIDRKGNEDGFKVSRIRLNGNNWVELDDEDELTWTGATGRVPQPNDEIANLGTPASQNVERGSWIRPLRYPD